MSGILTDDKTVQSSANSPYYTRRNNLSAGTNPWRLAYQITSNIMTVHSFYRQVIQWITSYQVLLLLIRPEARNPWQASPRAHLHVVGMLRVMSDINQPSLPTPFYSVLVSIYVFMALSTVFDSINSPDNSVSSLCSSDLISALFILSTMYLFM